MEYIFQILGFCFWLLALGLTWLSTRVTLRKLASFPPQADMAYQLYPITILKPLKGVDPGLSQNLESFFHLDYPAYELLFSIADAKDPARSIVEDLMRRFPGINCRLFIGEEVVGINPKVNNIVRSFESAQNDLILISDSNIRVRANYLKRVAAHMDQSVGVVTAVVAGFAPSGLGGWLETIYLNTFYARGMNIAFHVGKPCVVGKSMLFRKSQALRFGGVRALGNYIAEDYILGEMMRKLGLRVVLMADPIPQFIGEYSLKDFWLRHLRWGRIRRAQAPVPFYLEPFIGCLSSGFLAAWALREWTGVSVAQVLVCHLIIWAVCDFAVSLKVQGQVNLWLPIAWFLRELLALPLWIHTAVSQVVSWRGQKYRLSPGGTVTLVQDGKTSIPLGRGYERSPN